ncbi:MAG: Flp pilus assembly protein CpaB [Caulobacterales bacterium]|jgi:pilus assembly protein CpaB
MNPARIAILVIAAVAAIALALVVRNMASKPKAPVVAAQSGPAPNLAQSRVLVAKQDLAIGQRLSIDNMSWQPWPVTNMNAAYITDGSTQAAKPSGADAAMRGATKTVTDIVNGGGPAMQAMVGAIVKDPIYAGEPITARKVVRAGQSSYMAVRLPAGMRAMSIPVNPETGAGGFILPGDRVDVMDSRPDASKGSGSFATETVLSNVLVLAIDTNTDAPKTGKAVTGAVATLEVPAASAQSLARARAQGGLMLALRSYADIGGGVSSAPRAAATTGVRVFKGGAPAEVVMSQ